MPTGLTFKLTGLDLSKLHEYSQAVQDGVNDDMDATAYDIEAEQKQAAPVDLGALRASIAAVNNGKSISVVASVDYAAYIEFGTGTFVDINPIITAGTLADFNQAYDELAAYAIQFKGAGIRQVNLPARHYFFPAVYRNMELLLERIAKTMQEAAE